MIEGERKTVEFAFTYAQKKKKQTSVGETVPDLIQLLNSAKTFWDEIVTPPSTYSLKTDCEIVSIEEQILETNNQIKVYPIPTKGNLVVASDELLQEIQIFGVTGVLVKRIEARTKYIEFDMSEFVNGVYFLRIQKQTTLGIIKK